MRNNKERFISIIQKSTLFLILISIIYVLCGYSVCSAKELAYRRPAQALFISTVPVDNWPNDYKIDGNSNLVTHVLHPYSKYQLEFDETLTGKHSDNPPEQLESE